MRGTVMETKREIIMRQIGAKIAYQRKIHGYSQNQLSQKLHLGKTVLSRVERGKYNQNISLNMLLDIAKGLGVPVSVFVPSRRGSRPSGTATASGIRW
ncbi:MAG: helix-turn-helix transcriptional regulator [Clostridia bacterium]|nr:helix-turn-helix transcriptional regulator [Clostridia bacterium]